MKSKPIALFAGSCIAGLALGYGAKRLTGNGDSTPPSAESAAAPGKSPRDAKGGSAGATGPGDLATLIPSAAKTRSTETLESLKADSTDLYARLALWMVDASQEDVKAFWDYYRTVPKRSNDINDIIFINWARIDPLAATTAAKGTPDEHYAWWAWACHDPKAALDAAIATNPDRINNVTWGIGEFHPDWTMKHWDELPEDCRDNALRGMAKWDDREHPEEILDFLKEHGHGFHSSLFKVLTVRDPWAAYDWLEKNKHAAGQDYADSDSVTKSFVNSLALYHPDVLNRIAENSPAGELRRSMEEKAFKTLLKTDLDAAIQQAEDTKGPAVAAGRLASVGMEVAKTDPERAFELAKKLFEVCPNPWDTGVTVMSPNGGSTRWGNGDGGQADGLLSALIAADPRRAMELGGESSSGYVYQHAASLWMQRDAEGFANWVENQPPEKRNSGVGIMVNQLMRDENYAEAAEWAASIPSNNYGSIANVIANWNSRDPEAARAWFEQAQLPEETRKGLKDYFNRSQQ